MENERLDILLVNKDLVNSRTLAQRLIMAGQVSVNGQVIIKSSTKVPIKSEINIKQRSRYVSRGGEKLAAALQTFQLVVNGKVCADVGSSTGGFTDCLLQNGAARVYSIDVGNGILDWKLRNDNRVMVMERTNARYLESLPEIVQIATIDVSFISLKKILPVVKNWLPALNMDKSDILNENRGIVIALIKPQFEAGRAEVNRGKGVIKDPEVHRKVLHDILSFSHDIGFSVRGVMRSPLAGPKGNIEFLLHLSEIAETSHSADALIENAMMS